eukprot:525227_1
MVSFMILNKWDNHALRLVLIVLGLSTLITLSFVHNTNEIQIINQTVINNKNTNSHDTGNETKNIHCEKLPFNLKRYEPAQHMIINKDKMLRLLILFSSFAEGNNIPYRLTEGTGLGAIRHHDMIPWDDDIDISIPNEYYQVTQKLLTKIIETNFTGLLKVWELSWYHGIIKLGYINDNNLINPPDYPYLDIFYPAGYYNETDTPKWAKAQNGKWFKHDFQSFLGIEEFNKFRYVFFYNENIDFANKLIFKIYYNLRKHEQHRLNTTV